MYKALLSFALFVGAAFPATAFGQSNPPAVPDNANPRDNNIKMRSAELDRIEREGKKSSTRPEVKTGKTLEDKFPEIKEDFEGLQVAEAAIIKTYTNDKVIDHALIAKSAEQIGGHAKRLETNLFLELKELPETAAKPKKADAAPKGLRELIIDLDSAIGRFVTSKLFANLKVVDPEVAASAHADLLMIRSLSEQLEAEAKRTK